MTIKTIGIFLLGVATGIAGSYYFIRKHFDKELEVEVESVKMVYGKHYGVSYEEAAKKYKGDQTPVVNPVTPTDYTAFFPKNNDYPGLNNPPIDDVNARADISETMTAPGSLKNEKGEYLLPYIIKPEAFGSNDDYDIHNILFNIKTFECIDLLDDRKLNAHDILGAEVFDHLDDPDILTADEMYVIDEVRHRYYEIEIVRPEEGDG